MVPKNGDKTFGQNLSRRQPSAFIGVGGAGGNRTRLAMIGALVALVAVLLALLATGASSSVGSGSGTGSGAGSGAGSRW